MASSDPSVGCVPRFGVIDVIRFLRHYHIYIPPPPPYTYMESQNRSSSLAKKGRLCVEITLDSRVTSLIPYA